MARTEGFWIDKGNGAYLTTIYAAGINILINGTDKYINFNSVSGVSGYGFRDNAGVMEYKHNGGAWTPISGGGGGGAVDSVNGQVGVVVLDYTDVGADAAGAAAAALVSAMAYTDSEIAAIDFPVDSVNGQTGTVVLDTGDIAEVVDKNYVTDADLVKLANTSGTNTGDQNLTPYFNKSVDDTDDITVGTTNKFATAAEKTKLGFITVTQAVDLDTIESDTVANNAKVTNATHTGEVTGSGALTVDKTAITGKTAATAVGADYVLISDTSDSGNLKKALVSDFMGGATLPDGDYGDVTVSGTGTVITIDNDVVTYAKIQNVSATSRILGRITTGAGDIEELTAANVKTILNLTTADVPDSTNKRYVTDAQLVVIGNTSGTNTGDQNLTNYFLKTADDTDDITVGTTNKFATAAEKTKLGFITVTQAVDLDTIESDTVANNAKVTNATHTGDVTGSGALTIDPTAITGKTLVTAVGTDYVLISDTSDSGNLKKVLVSDFGGGSGATTALDNLAAVAINAALVLGTSDAFALGSATKQWSDLFLAEGGVINWDNGDLTLTQAGNKLTLDGGILQVVTSIPITTIADYPIVAEQTNAGNNGAFIATFHNSASPAANDSIGGWDMYGKDSAGNTQLYAYINAIVTDPTSASEDSKFLFNVTTAGTAADELELTGLALYPTSNDGLSLGLAAQSFADLFLASGAVINFANGNAVITHSSGIITVSTGDLRVTTAGTNTASVVTVGGTQTLTSKRITPRIGTEASSATSTPTADTVDQWNITALAAADAIAAPSGTPTDGQRLMIRIKDNGTARVLTWNAIYRAIGTVLPATTVISKTLYVGFVYNAADSKWDCLAVAQEQ